MTREEFERRMALACPHGPDEPCTCDGCGACAGHERDCTCDIDWDEIHELREFERLDGVKE